MDDSKSTSSQRRQIRIRGLTQGVGFRPFVWRLADAFDLSGWVQNDSSGLYLEIQGSQQSIDGFLERLRSAPPDLARIDSLDVATVSPQLSPGRFAIRESQTQVSASTCVPQDISICEDCLRELGDPSDRRHGYPFINCTNCGPRFTILKELPYDRAKTTMRAFTMCPSCQAEYADPANRRFHAQPNACYDCGPCVWYEEGKDLQPALEGLDGIESPNANSPLNSDAIRCFCQAVLDGQIVAVKGIGGFHLICDARNQPAIAELRRRKGRIEKPFAVMAASVTAAREFAFVNDIEAALLESIERPIVLLQKRTAGSNCSMLEGVSPGNALVGVLLPYSPLHYRLVEGLGPLVVTSGNLADEPIARTNLEAATRLANLSDSFLFHNREINIVCDDSIVRRVETNVLPLRRSRGYAPTSFQLDACGSSVLAVGGELKASFCVTKDNYAYLSQHLGDVENLETLESLERNVEHFLKLFSIDLDGVAGDMHPGYLSGQWAQQLASRLGVPYLPVQHHHAHAASLLAEHARPIGEEIIACCFDGTGYGNDHAIWGGEFLIASAKRSHRFAHLRYFPLLGGDASIKHPYRTALSLLSECQLPRREGLPCVSGVPLEERRILQVQCERKINSVLCSSMGRLFDAVSSLIGIRQSISYEAQAAIELEAAASEAIETVVPQAYSFDIQTDSSETTEIDFCSLLRNMYHDVLRGDAPCLLAARFHHAVARMIIEVCEAARKQTQLNTVGLTGGVFQNALLSELVMEGLRAAGFQVLTHSVVPPNDGGLALGQAIIARQALSSNQHSKFRESR